MQLTTPKQQRASAIHASYKPRTQPFHLMWQGKDYFIAGVTSYHVRLTGNEPLHVFKVNSKQDEFILELTNDEVAWFLG